MGHPSWLFTITGLGAKNVRLDWTALKEKNPIAHTYWLRVAGEKEDFQQPWTIYKVCTVLFNYWKSLSYWHGIENEEGRIAWRDLLIDGLVWGKGQNNNSKEEKDELSDDEKEGQDWDYTGGLFYRPCLSDEQSLGGRGIRIYFEVEDHVYRWYLEASPDTQDLILGASFTFDTHTTKIDSLLEAKLKSQEIPSDQEDEDQEYHDEREEILKELQMECRNLSVNEFKWFRVSFDSPKIEIKSLYNAWKQYAC